MYGLIGEGGKLHETGSGDYTARDDENFN